MNDLEEQRCAVATEISRNYRHYKSIQKPRKAMRERIRSVEQGRADLFIDREREWYKSLLAIEKNVHKTLVVWARKHYVYTDYLVDVRGIGEILACGLIGEIGRLRGKNGHLGIAAYDRVSNLWHFAGLIPGAKHIKGEKSSFSSRVRTLCAYDVGESFIKSRSPYKRLYDERKLYTQVTHPDWSKGHRHQDARRIMVKIFLQHVWHRWRQMEGLPINLPYVIEREGHSHLYRWQEFIGNGEPDVSLDTPGD